MVADVTELNVVTSRSKGERQVEFKLVNKGIGSTGEVALNLPKVNWLRSVTPERIASLATGDTATVILKFLALEEVPFSFPINGSIGVATKNGNSFSLPFTFEKKSETAGKVKITVTNQFTYYSEGAPKVKDAKVQIKNYFTGQVYAEGFTDAAGNFAAGNIPEGKHRIIVEKEKHLSYNSTITIDPGETTEASIFLNYQAITFSWNVVPTAVEDQYDITLEAQFETHVPIPVVTIDMPKTMPQLSGNETYAFNVTLTNHGLITAEDVALNLPKNDPEYEFVTNYEPAALLAQQSIQVPVTMRRRNGSAASVASGGQTVAAISQLLGMDPSQYSAMASQSLSCQDITYVVYWYKCNIVTGLWEENGVMFTFDGRVCTGSPGGGGGGILIGGGGFGGGGGFPNCAICPDPSIWDGDKNWTNPFKTEKKSCVQCINDVIGAAAGCASGGASGYIGAASCSFGNGLDGGSIGQAYLNCLPWPVPPPISCIVGVITAINTCANTEVAGASLASKSAILGNYFNTGNSIIPQASEPELGAVFKQIANNLQVVTDAYQARESWAKEYFGDIIKSNAYEDLAPKLEVYIVNLDSIPKATQLSILNSMKGYEINEVALKAFFNRWHTSLNARNLGVLEPNTQYPNIINWKKIKTYSDTIIAQIKKATNLGYASINEMYEKENAALNEILDNQQQAVCASVKVQINQRLTMTREAFEGTLDIFNGHPTDKMDSLSVVIQIRDAKGVPSNGLFEIQTKDLKNLSDITGTGKIAAQQNSLVKFLFIPELGAAPTEPKEYNFGGYVRYWDPYAQAMVTLPLASVPLTINPSPNLMLHYFMERNILGDDALTSPEIEPTVPAELAVMVENQGYGPAVNMTIASAQPKIVENEKGLAIEFKIIGSNFQGKPKELGVTDINFGTIPGRQTRIGQWYFTSTLLGKFVSYESKVVHANSFGNPELSLVKGAKLHELTRSIRAYGAKEDSINDFLANDIFDVHDEPDVIYFSQGQRTEKVYPAKSGKFSTSVAAPTFTNTFTVTASKVGWNFVKVDDPGNNQYDVVSVTRSDGQVIPITNAWLTFVTLPVSRPPVYENKFHFVDKLASLQPVTYTVVWKPRNRDVPKIVRIEGAPQEVATTQVKKLKVVFDKSINPATFTYEDLRLTLQGGPDIINKSVVVKPLNATTFEIDLSKVTTGNGFYNLTVQAAQVQDIFGINGKTGVQATWPQFLDVPIVQEFRGLPENRVAQTYDTLQVFFNLPINVSTVTPDRFIITRNKVVQPGKVIIDSVRADNKLFYLSGLKNILTQSGVYDFTVDLPQIKSVGNKAGSLKQTIALTVDKTGPVNVSLTKSNTGGLDAQHYPFINIQFKEAVEGFNTASVQLTRNGEILPLAITQLLHLDSTAWVAGNFGMLTYPEGQYIFKINLSGIKDAAGNAGTGSKQVSWTVDRSAGISVTKLAITPDLGFSNTDGITSGDSLLVSFNLSAKASQITISQIDLSGQMVLKHVYKVAAGAVSIPVILQSSGNTGLKITATAEKGGVATAEKRFFVDQVPLTAEWQLKPAPSLKRQLDTVQIAFSAKLLSTQEFRNAIQLKRNGVSVSIKNLNFKAINDTLYRISGIRSTSSLAGDYQLLFQTQNLKKYGSGRRGEKTLSVDWTVQSSNRAPVAIAGNDTTIAAAGTVVLNGAASKDPDQDKITYRWIAPAGITLSDSLTAKPSFVVSSANQGKTYAFLLIVSDGALFTTDVVQVRINFGWNFRFGGSGSDQLTDVIRTSDGGYLAGGYSDSGVSGDKSEASRGGVDYWIVKTDKDGAMLWNKRYGGTSQDYLNSIIATKDGGYLLGGSSASSVNGDRTATNRGNLDYWVVKVDKLGNKQWDKAFGGSGADELKKIIQISTGEFLLGGYSNSPVSGDKSQPSQGGTDYWLVKISSTGTKVWDKRYGGSLDEKLGSFTPTTDGGFFLGGSSVSNTSGDKSQPSRGGSDYWGVKVDKTGNLLWDKTFGGSGQDEVYSVRPSNGTNLYLAGTSTSGKNGDKSQASRGGKDYWLVKLDDKGTKIWDSGFGGSKDDELQASTYTTEGQYILAGHSVSQESGDKTQPSQGGSDYWMVQVDQDGQKVVDQRYGGSGTEELRTVFQTNDNGLLLGGRSSSGVGGDKTQPSQGGLDYWLVKVEAMVKRNTSRVATTVSPARNIVLPDSQEDKPELKNLVLFEVKPNPFANKVTISILVPASQLINLKIYDPQGQELTTLYQGKVEGGKRYALDWQPNEQFSTGLYILRLYTAGKTYQQKVIFAK
ncbi:T9SS type A sorting domain-containing protein [Adhaeribacter pallidiroseus]|uniref:Cellulose 1,4-beta-cellobiosidase (Non-reducing end) n=1 Tax=Adhaeribacter pallidiroseus TaxID=2072847 RepID=A0A369QH21_9BACT|nr:T9SS type A sorting domain-containing protein [Adhaeribacter pallidiroseus]RDC62516.1 Cellulose 1,4-beta-cellobiosidase (non-reducing end) [Adhaeribacter pallidiroseus]